MPKKKPVKKDDQYEISPRVIREASTRPYQTTPGAPPVRPLRIYTLDPSVSHRLGGIATVDVPYEALQPGPIGALFEIDGSGAPTPLAADKLDLNQPSVLLTDGLSPNPGDGQFHLQMTYAACSLTYAAFRRALGRDISWSVEPPAAGGRARLRVRPFGMREENAYFDRDEGGLSFGYFRARRVPGGHTVPNGLIFTALSHDVVVHETTHAMLDALRAEFYAPTNRDVLGFHEGFADLVALFQHFSYADVVEAAIRDSRGNLSHAGLLTDLAQEFGHATSSPRETRALRSAIDVEGLAAFDSDAMLAGKRDPKPYRANMEVHDMGSVLVSAVFEAFVTIFRRKTQPLLRLAGIPSEEVGQRELGPELVHALAEEASQVADNFLNICIRAIDYCPPLDMSLGEYLRALITADAAMVVRDKWGYREALMRSFRRRRMFPEGVEFMTEDALKWSAPATPIRIPGLAFRDLSFDGDPAHPADAAELMRQARALGQFVASPEQAPRFHLVAPGTPLPKGIEYASLPRVESIRCARRVGPDDNVSFDLVAEVIQSGTARRGRDLFDFSGGCTLIIDPYGQVRYAIYKNLLSEERQSHQHASIRGPLKRYWQKSRGKYQPRKGVLRMLHTIPARQGK